MPIFKIEDGRLRKLPAVAVDSERRLQRLLEANLMEALRLHFVASEYTTTLGGRIDTLAVDENGCPVIIEYKKTRNDNVINQSLSYLKWLKTQKREFFEKLVLDRLPKEIGPQVEIDWANPRVMCVAESFSKYDIDTVEVVPLRIELFRFRFYADDVFSLEPVTVVEDEPIRETSAPAKIKAASSARESDGTEPSLERLLGIATPEIKSLFADLREWVTALDEVVKEKVTKLYVSYRTTSNFMEVYIQKNSLKVLLRPVDYADPSGMVERISDGYNWTLNRRLYIRDEASLIMGQLIIEQSYRDVL